MDRDGITEDFLATVAGSLEVDPGEITLRTRRGDLPEWDSLGHLKLFLAVEGMFDVRFSTREIEQAASLLEILEGVRAKLGG